MAKNDVLKIYSQVFLSEGLENAQKVYAKRRREHLKNLDSLCIYASVQSENHDRICQNPEFLYLTGINQSGPILALDPLAKNENEREILFLPEKDSKKEFWNGIRLGLPDAHVNEITGFETILPMKKFSSWFKKRILNLKTKHIFSNEAMKRRLLRCKANVKDVSKIHFEQRVVLERERIALAKKTQEIARDAFLKILPRISKYKNERVLSADLECFMLQRTGTGLAFPSIVAAGENACTLHYAKKDCPIEKGNLILLDFGCRYNAVCCDISRTIPASGKFNPLQKLLYNIVLDTQKFHEENVKAGLTLKEIGELAWLYLERILDERFTKRGGKMKRRYIGKPHGISHLIGDIVHEGAQNRDYLKKPLRAGMLISNEPGIYGYFELEIDGALYSEHIGIRIEDDLLVTEDGCINLSAEIPKIIDG
ncbi:MAG: Xaa-Pro aminopeptidase [Fibromonadales bacterium]|nr:Xaa-Pro aminopeptidase [Fibromonadales bacterium]